MLITLTETNASRVEIVNGIRISFGPVMRQGAIND